jgi:hypothetical protein
MPKQPRRIPCPSYRIGPDWAGMMLGPFGGGGFEYPGRQPAEYAALIEQAIARLQAP